MLQSLHRVWYRSNSLTKNLNKKNWSYEKLSKTIIFDGRCGIIQSYFRSHTPFKFSGSDTIFDPEHAASYQIICTRKRNLMFYKKGIQFSQCPFAAGIKIPQPCFSVLKCLHIITLRCFCPMIVWALMRLSRKAWRRKWFTCILLVWNSKSL